MNHVLGRGGGRPPNAGRAGKFGTWRKENFQGHVARELYLGQCRKNFLPANVSRPGLAPVAFRKMNIAQAPSSLKNGRAKPALLEGHMIGVQMQEHVRLSDHVDEF